MKLIFINTAYPQECYEQIKADANGIIQAPVNVFQWAVIEGLERNSVNYTLVCTPALPAYPRYKHLYTPQGEMSVEGKVRGHYLRYCNLPAIKQLSERRVLRKYINQWCKENQNEDRLVALVYTQNVAQMGAAIDLKNKYPNLIVVPIVTDLIDNAMDFASNRSLLKRVQIKLEEKGERKLFPKVDKFILLTAQMTECIPEADGKYIVVEGIAPKDSLISNGTTNKGSEVRTILYTGVLEEYAGINHLVDSFHSTSNTSFKLVICGSGTSAVYIRKIAESDSRIIYKGRVDRDEAVQLQRESTLLINPRIPNGGITKYSFPSKTMEYMTSLTPMIGYHLEGMPEEYYEHMFTPDDLSVEALAKCINDTLTLPLDVLKSKAERAYAYIVDNKNSKKQIKRIIDFVCS